MNNMRHISFRVIAGVIALLLFLCCGLLVTFLFDSLIHKVNAAVFFIMGIKLGLFAVTGKDKLFIWRQ
jgi:uncharacterized membrane protein YjfL (UPF0719 family)